MVVSSGVAIALFALTTLLYLVLAVLRGRSTEEIFTSVLACGGYTVVLFAISLTKGELVGQWMLVASSLNTLILVVTLGDPARMYDPGSMKAKAFRRLPKEVRRAYRRRGAQVAHSQTAFLALVVLGVILFAAFDLDLRVR